MVNSCAVILRHGYDGKMNSRVDRRQQKAAETLEISQWQYD